MTDTDLHDKLLDKPNVVAVGETEDGTVRAFVKQKVPEESLNEDDIVANAVPDHETDVVDVDGDISPELLIPDEAPLEAQADRHDRHRPVEAGVSEIHIESTAATSGPYPARVEDTDKGAWASDIKEGTIVRLSNCHVYALSGNANFGEQIVQPSPYDQQDGSLVEDTTGTLVGFLPLQDGVLADVAARSIDKPNEAVSPHDLSGEWPTDIFRGDPRELVGETLCKTGRTTGYSEAPVISVNASVRVRYPDPVGVVTLRNQVITRDMSDGGDSGSPVFGKSGNIVGHLTCLLFAGSPRVTVVSPIANVEEAFGVKLMTDEPDSQEHESERTFEDWVEEELVETYGRDNVDRQYRLPSGRQPDFVVEDPRQSCYYAIELENSSKDLVGGVGQAVYYAAELRDVVDSPVVPALYTPEGHIDEEERPYLRQCVGILRELSPPSDVSLEGV